MRVFSRLIFGLWLCGLPMLAAGADTYSLTDGASLIGDIVTFNDSGITFRQAGDTYTNVSWTQFSQAGLKQLAQNPKIKPYVEPFIETPESALVKKEPVKIHAVPRLTLPPRQSLLGAMFSSSVGLVIMLLLYAANVYAAFEIALFRARPIPLVVGVGAVLPVLGPIIFLSMPTYVPPVEEVEMPAETATFAMPGAAAPGTPTPAAEAPGGLHIAAAGSEAAAAQQPAQVFQRGQFTFNRRFFETKFSGFFSVVRRASEKDLELIVKSMRGQYVVQRITRIAANDVHFEVVKGPASHEVMVPFAEIQEIQLKHKDA
jgi:hypothetical protein